MLDEVDDAAGVAVGDLLARGSARSSAKRISRPLLRKAIIWSRSRSVWARNSVSSKIVRVGPERHRGAGAVRGARCRSTLSCFLTLAAVDELGHVVLAVAVDLEHEPASTGRSRPRRRRRAGRPRPCSPTPPNLPPACSMVSTSSAAEMSGYWWMRLDRDAAAVVGHPAAAVGQQGDVDLGGVARHGLVDGVVDDLPDQVVQARRTRSSRCTCRAAPGPARGPRER